MSSFYKRQPGIRTIPRRTDPDMLGILRHGKGAGRSGKKIQVVNVIPGAGDYGMEATANQHSIAIAGFQGTLVRVLTRIEMLEGEPFRLANPVIVNLIQVDLRGRIVYVVLMRRIT